MGKPGNYHIEKWKLLVSSLITTGLGIAIAIPLVAVIKPILKEVA
ncbi:hypothetical protein [Clostridium sp. CF012]|nr:hypothetical protein [Clostridium sp. CF012]